MPGHSPQSFLDASRPPATALTALTALNQPDHPACFALLDDHSATPQAPHSRLYTGHVETLHADQADGLPGLLAAVEAALQRGLYAVGLFSYEHGARAQGIPGPGHAADPTQVLLFDSCIRLSAAQVDAWLESHVTSVDKEKTDGDPPAPAGITDLQPSVSEAAFHAAIAHIHEAIAAGEVYQVNYTWRLRFNAFGSPAALYRRLRARQAVPYGALIALPDGRTVLSLSPELLLRHSAGELLARPMKGTAAATGDAAADATAAQALAADAKNRAENVMITDLLRNDLGRVAAYGSVRVPRLFDVQRHGSVLQMTSEIRAQLKQDGEGTSLTDLFAAVYPCGSITGAPKHRAIQLIQRLEPDARGLYTGAIGWFEAPTTPGRPGDFCLSVPIRTLVLDAPDAAGLRAGELGVGAGIVHDSVAADEYAECRLKAGFLTGLGHDFEIFETMRAGAAGCAHFALHVARLFASAEVFGFTVDTPAIHAALVKACSQMAPGQPHRLRLAIRFSGEVTVQAAPLQSLAALENGGAVRVRLAGQPTRRHDLFLRHKTSVRAAYDAAWREAESQGAFDQLFFNAEGELTEGGRSNVFVKLEGRWYTPPLSSGLLPGVMRAVMLADPALGATERVLRREDLDAAEALLLCNALRGAMPARLG